jgi:signal transduction histidine kinase
MAAAILSAAAVFIQLQKSALAAAESEKVRLLVESVGRMANESMLAKDPLMLLDYLSFLRKERPEVHRCSVRMEGRWQDIGAPAGSGPPGGLRVETISLPDPSGNPAKAVSIEIHFSSAVLQRREQQAYKSMLHNMARAAGCVLLLGLALSIPLSLTLTRRIVQIETALAAIGEGRLGERVPERGSDEIAHLARNVNLMSEKLKELEGMKRTFVASVTHELRSPLGAIQSLVKLLLLEPSRWREEDRANLGRIQKNAARLEHFVTNLLEVSRIERGKLEFSPRDADLGQIAEDTAAFFAPRAAEAGIKIASEIEPDLPSQRFDPDLIAQVLTNLVSNAIKFTRPGGFIRIQIKRLPDGLECAVADTGVGIPAPDLDRLFKPFERIHNPLRSSGAGLGLAISKSIVEMHGGRIGAESCVGAGSRFFFVLPPRSAAKIQPRRSS